MKSIVSTKSKGGKKEYPYLGIFSDNNDEVVLFTSENTGTSVSHHRPGHYSTYWNEGSAKRLKGTVILSND